MPRSIVILRSLFFLALGVLLAVPAAEAQQPPPPTTRTLVNQRVEELPQVPLCWRVLRTGLPPGVRDPAEGFAARPLAVGYQSEGEQRIDYAGGPSRVVRAGDGNFIGANNWFARTNIGTVPAPGIVFQLTCARPSLLAPGTSHAATTPTLPGIRPGPVPYQVQLLEVIGRPGSQTPSQSTTGPLTSYFLEGTVAVTTPAGVKQYKAGDLLVIAPDTPYSTATVGDTTARADRSNPSIRT